MKNTLKRLLVFLLICSMFFTSSGFTNLAYATSVDDVDYEEQNSEAELSEAQDEDQPEVAEEVKPSNSDTIIESDDPAPEPEEEIKAESSHNNAQVSPGYGEETSQYLKNFIKAVKIAGAPYDAATGAYNVEADKDYPIHLLFEECGQNGIQFDHSQMVYYMPAGMKAADGKGTLAVHAGGAVIQNNPYHIQDNTLIFEWNKSDPNYTKMLSSYNTQIVITLRAQIGSNVKVLDFGTEVKTPIVVRQTKEDADDDEESASLQAEVPAMSPGKSEDFFSILGENVAYGMVANELTLKGHLESNFATGFLHGNADVQTARNEEGGAGVTYVGAYDGSNFKMTSNGNTGTVLIYADEIAAMKNFGTNMIGDYPKNIRFPDGVVIDFTTYNKDEIQSYVSGLVEFARSRSTALYNEGQAHGYNYNDIVEDIDSAHIKVDIAAHGSQPGTYYINYDPNVYGTGNKMLHVILRYDQNVVFNIPDTEVGFQQYTCEIIQEDGSVYNKTTAADASEDMICQKVTFNAPNATVAATKSPTSGTFLVPNADFGTDAVAAGWVVADTISHIGGQEWHSVYHDAKVVSYGLTAKKTVDGVLPSSAERGKFTFKLYAVDENGENPALIDTKTNDGSAVAFDSFKNITQKGTYYYKITEEGSVAGYTIDNTVYFAKVEVKDSSKITSLTAEITYYKDSFHGQKVKLPTFDNHKAQDKKVRAHFEARKTLSGRTLKNAEFKFELRQKGSDTILQTKSNTTGGMVTFDEIEYTAAGTYEYTITEKVEGKKGITYDTTVHNAKVVVTEQDGQLVASVLYDGNKTEAPVFTNNYTSEGTSAVVEAAKELSGRQLESNEFEFTLSDKDGVIQTVKNNGEAVQFAAISYDKAGTYTYSLKEKAGSKGGVSYDTTEYTVVVTVTDDEGTLHAVVDYYKDGKKVEAANVVFHNEYKAKGTKAQLHAAKELSGRQLKDNEFSFTLNDGTKDLETVTNKGQAVDFTELSYDKAGTYEYTISEVVGELGGVTYDTTTYKAVVTVTDDLAGQLHAKVEYFKDGKKVEAANVVFKNDYSSEGTNAVVEAAKELSGRQLESNEFEFTLSDKDGVIQTVKNTGAAVRFAAISYDKAGTYTYTLKETVGSKGGVKYDTTEYKVVVTVTDDGEGALHADVKYYDKDNKEVQKANVVFHNEYKAKGTKVQLHAAKELSGRQLKDNEFSFTLNDGTKDLETVTNKGQAVDFTELSYDKAGTYEYTISEVVGELGGVTYDTTTYKAVVTVTDDLEGQLHAKVEYFKDGKKVEAANVVFKNDYSSEGTSAVVEAAKELSGRQLESNEFEFTLSDKDSVIQTVKNTGAAVRFAAISYDKAGTYTYTLKETVGSKGGVKYDTTEYKVVVTVTDDGEGALHADVKYYDKDNKEVQKANVVFHNEYKAKGTKVQLHAAKELSGRQLKDSEFSFTLNDGTKDLETVTNKGQAVDFTELSYDKAGTYEYTISEVVGELGGVTYDTTTYKAVVTVTDDLAGQLHAAVEYFKDGKKVEAANVVFKNDYSSEGTSAVVEAAKELIGRQIENNEFEFTLSDKDGVIQTVKNTGAVVRFAAISYDKAGTYTYTLKETVGSKGGVKYDTTEYKVVVTVTDDGEGALHADVKYYDKDNKGVQKANVKFSNEYKAKGTKAQLHVAKELSGRQLKDSEFSFTLNDGTKDLETVTNKGQAVDFTELSYDKAGTYEYIISEVVGELGGVTYDTTIYTAVVTVTDDLVGQLHAAVEYFKDGKKVEAAKVVFKNDYSSEGTSAVVEAAKELIGRQIESNEFEFTLSDKDGVIQTVKNTGAVVRFNAISYDKAGTYTYTLKETVGSKGGVKYDTTEYKVVVTVTDDGEGALHAGVKYYDKDDKEVQKANVKFSNEYKAKGTKAQLHAAKELSGRQLKDNEFSFTLNDGTKDLETVTNKGQAVDFTELSYNKTGTYEYTISEVPNTTKDGVTYDATVYTAKVVVTDDLVGQLHAVVTYYDAKGEKVEAANVVFHNTYEAKGTKAELKAAKELSGRQLKDNEFEFTLKDQAGKELEKVSNNGKEVNFKAISYNAAGIYEYTISEVPGELGGVTYDATVYKAVVTVTDDLEGQLHAAVTYYDAKGEKVEAANVVFHNAYNSEKTSAIIEAAKELIGRQLVDHEFEFTLKDKDGNELEKVTNNGAEVKFSALEYTEVGTHEYTINEVVGTLGGVKYDETVYTVKVVVTDDGEGALHAAVTYYDAKGKEVEKANVKFSNEYTAKGTKAKLQAAKELTGRQLVDNEFSFTLTEGEKALETVTNKGQAVDFTELSYNKAGTYEYTISEVPNTTKGGVTYDATVYTAKVVVTDDLEGQLHAVVTYYDAKGEKVEAANVVFHNTYEAKGTKVQLHAAKELTGRQLKDNEFSFTLKEGEKALETVTNKGQAVDFAELSYNKAGTYEYTISEVPNTTKGGVTYDATVYTAKVVVTDDLEGQLHAVVTYYDAKGEKVEAANVVFRNTYEAKGTKAQLHAAKELTGRQLVANEFSFTLTEGEKALETVTNKGQAVDFTELSYNKAGTYEYTISEVPNTTKGGVTYDATVYTAKVVVTDDLEGQLHAAVTYYDTKGEKVEAANVVFHNTYKAKATEAQLKASKELTGRQLKDNEFSFTLNDGTKDVETVTNKGQEVNFAKLTYDKVGTYTYTIREVVSDLGGVTYDTTVYTAVVTVTDDLAGQLHAAVAYYNAKGEEVEAAKVVFKNAYEAKGSIDLAAKKVLTGRTLKAEEFSFTMIQVADAEGTELEGAEAVTVKNAADGSVTFPTLNYVQNASQKDAETGKFFYKVTEDAGDLAGVTYDNKEVIITVTVTDNEDGTLTVVADKTLEDLTFTNAYEAKGSIDLNAQKVLKSLADDRVLKEGEFSFTMIQVADAEGTKLDGATAVTVKNDAEGKVTFPTLHYVQNASQKDAETGKFFYKVTEDVPETKEEGMTYDTKEVIITVTVTDNEDGTLTAVADKTIEDLTFTNVYDDGQISITKNVTVKGKKANKKSGSFYVALFSDEACTKLIPGKILEIAFHGSASETVTFTHLKAGTYYVAETDKDGNVLPKKYEDRPKIYITVNGDHKKPVEITKASKNGYAEITNDYSAPDEHLDVYKDIEITKSVTEEGKKVKAQGSFYFAIFTDEALTEYLASDNEGKPIGNDGIIELNEENNYHNGAHDMLLDDGMYYVAEVNKDGVPVDQDPSFPYTVYFDKQKINVGKADLNDNTPSANFDVINDKAENIKELEITKHMTRNEEDLPEDSDFSADFYVTVFTDKAFKTVAKDIDGNEIKAEKMSIIDGNDSETLVFTMPDVDQKYYIVETNKDGKPVGSSFKYTVSYNGEYKSAYEVEYKKGVSDTKSVIINNDITTTTTEHHGGGGGGGEGTGSGSAKTGDDNALSLYMLLCLAGLAIGGVELRRRRKEEN